MPVDLAVVACYGLAMLTVGWSSRRQSRESYVVAERQFGTGRITASLVMTIFGASTTMGVISLGYSRGLTGAWWPLTGAVALLPFGFFLAGRVRALSVYTLPDVLQRAYGNRVAVPAALVIAVSWCGIIAAQMVAAARLVSGVFPVGYVAALALVALVFVLYTFWGGQVSVVRTDSWQLVVFVVGLLLCLSFLSVGSLGAGGISAGLPPPEHLRFPVSAAFGWYDLLVYYPLIVGLPFLVGPDLFSRMLCAKDEVVAKRSTFITSATIVPIAFALVVLGLLIRARIPDVAPDAALPQAINQLFPIGVKGLIVAAFLAALMSSADTTLITAATILSLNVLTPIGSQTRSQQLRHTKACLVIVGCAAWLFAGFQQGIISSLLLGYTIFVGGVVVPTLASFYRERLGVTSAGAMWAVIVGGGAAILGAIRDGNLLRGLLGTGGDSVLQLSLGPRYAAILPLALSVLVMFLVSRLNGAER